MAGASQAPLAPAAFTNSALTSSSDVVRARSGSGGADRSAHILRFGHSVALKGRYSALRERGARCYNVAGHRDRAFVCDLRCLWRSSGDDGGGKDGERERFCHPCECGDIARTAPSAGSMRATGGAGASCTSSADRSTSRIDSAESPSITARWGKQLPVAQIRAVTLRNPSEISRSSRYASMRPARALWLRCCVVVIMAAVGCGRVGELGGACACVRLGGGIDVCFIRASVVAVMLDARGSGLSGPVSSVNGSMVATEASDGGCVNENCLLQSVESCLKREHTYLRYTRAKTRACSKWREGYAQDVRYENLNAAQFPPFLALVASLHVFSSFAAVICKLQLQEF
eukprot:IDg18900t1